MAHFRKDRGVFLNKRIRFLEIANRDLDECTSCWCERAKFGKIALLLLLGGCLGS
jgi:hypothetical protein